MAMCEHADGGQRGGVGVSRALPVLADVAESTAGLAPVGLDFLTFLAGTVLVIPVCKRFGISPILGFLGTGAGATALGLLRSVEDIYEISELGVLFLLFEMGLELSSDRLRALARYAFGLGSLQMLLTSAVFLLCALPVGQGPISWLLTTFLHADPLLVNIRGIDEALVISVALSLSSSAFVLQILGDSGELTSTFGSATLGVLLLQDIAVVPFLVLLPLLEAQDLDPTDFTQDVAFLQQVWPAAAVSLGALGLTVLAGKLFLRKALAAVGEVRSPETFLAMCLLTVAGTSYLTANLGYSDSMGAFLAGVLLAESNFKGQVEADIQPFKGILLGLFFFATGASIDLDLLVENWDIVLALVFGLIAFKATVLTSLGPRFGLSRAESVRTGLILSQGGEFAFVLLALSQQLGVLPTDLNKILIAVVVLSMSLTPALNSLGQRLSTAIEESEAQMDPWSSLDEGDWQALDTSFMDEMNHRGADGDDASRRALALTAVFDPVVIIGYEGVGPIVTRMISSPSIAPEPCVIVFDESEEACVSARIAGFPAAVVDVSGASAAPPPPPKMRPRAVVVCLREEDDAIDAIVTTRARYPGTRILAAALDTQSARAMMEAGADSAVDAAMEPGLRLGSELLRGLGVMETELVAARSNLRLAPKRKAKVSRKA